MSANTEKCSGCGTDVICGHSISLDGSRRLWRLCCLCTAELIARFDGAKETVTE